MLNTDDQPIPDHQRKAAVKLQSIAEASAHRLNEEYSELPQRDRNRAISSLLKALAAEQESQDLPLESPAIIVDETLGEILAVSAASSTRLNDASRPATIECMQKAASELTRRTREAGTNRNVSEFSDHYISLHIIGEPGRFDASAAVYLYAPKEIFVTPPEDSPSSQFALPVSEEYWREAGLKRGIIWQQAPESDPIELSPSESSDSLRAPELPKIQQPPEVEFALNRWGDRVLDLSTLRSSEKDRGMVRELEELMTELHELAAVSVKSGGGPFAAAVIEPNGRVLSFGVNRVLPGSDAIAHGERSAIAEALEAAERSDLRGFTLVTSSFTCVSCAEQAHFTGISTIVFDNNRTEVETQTPFTEGPLRADFSSLTGIRFVRIQTQDAPLRSLAFREFEKAIQRDPAKSYLQDGSVI